MCGITGFSGETDKKLLAAMTEMIRHRGPDDYGYYTDGLMNLGMRRLSIVDIESGRQPLSNEDGSIWVVFNGEIYNHEPLRKELEFRDHRFRTDHSDTEVIVHLYEEYGEDWPNRTNGMFGVAIWDVPRKKLLLYRDRIGKKPLYYALVNGGIVFGSEIKSILLHPEISRDLDLYALYHYFGLKNVSAPSSVYRNIRQLLPGQMLIWEDGTVNKRHYWQLDFSSPLDDITEEEAGAHLLQLLEDSVRLRMQCDAPYGAYLSGGVDSSSVVAIMCRNLSEPVKSFSLGYEDRAEGQFIGKALDVEYARMMSERLGTEHYEYVINAEQFAREMPSILKAFDEPFSGVVSTFFLSILIKKHVKVALSGDGADELFGSYLSHRLAFPMEKYLALRARGRNDWAELTREERETLTPFDNHDQFQFLKILASDKMAAWRAKLCVFSHAERRRLLSPDFLDAIDFLNISDIYEEMEPRLTAEDILNRSLEMDQKELLPNQVLPFVDRLSMAHSIEVRIPYLDYRIIEFSNRLPGRLKIRNGTVKYIHKKAVEKLLPEDLVRRPKEGFVQPIYSWMHTSLREWVRDRLETLPEEYFNLEYVRSLKESFLAGDHSLNAKIWNLVCFNIWYQGLE